MKIRKTHLTFLWVLFVLLIGLTQYSCENSGKQQPPESKELQKVTINEALRTLLYLPLYHAKESGFFEKNGLNVEIVTGGTATNSFAAMLSGDADFSQADPMYVPIANEKGSKTKVVCQVVARIAVWGVTMDSSVSDMSKQSIEGKKISTHPRPMTAYTYTIKTIRDAGLEPDKQVEIVESQPGTEITPLLQGQSNFALTLEPNVSTAVNKGAHVVLSYPKLLGDQIFTGLMTRDDYISQNPDVVKSVIKSYQEAFNDIYQNPDAALATAKKYFPQLEEGVLRMAINRMIDEKVIPTSVLASDESWNKAVAERVKIGDLKSASSINENWTIELVNEANK